MSFLQLALDGIALGSAYALVAAGFVLTLNASRAVNFAHGDLVMVGGFAAVVLLSLLPPNLPLPGLVILLLVLLLLGVVGLLLAGVAFLPLRTRPVVAVFVSTIAVGIILQNAATAWFGAQPRVGPSLVGGGLVEIAGLRLGRQGLAVIAVAAIAYAGLYILLAKTQLGRKLRAAAQDPAMAEALGIPVTRMILTAFALSAALAGAAGVLLSNSYFVSPTEGANLMLKAYIAATIGGWGRLHGAALGALAIGLFETVAATLAGPVAAEAMLYGALLAVLAFKPSGVFGEQAGSRA